MTSFSVFKAVRIVILCHNLLIFKTMARKAAAKKKTSTRGKAKKATGGGAKS